MTPLAPSSGIVTSAAIVHDLFLKSGAEPSGIRIIYNFGQQPVQFAVGGRVYADSPEGGPDWGLRGAVTFLFPTGG